MIHLKRSVDGQYYFTVNARNGKVLMTSETYKRKRSALKGIAALQGAVLVVKDHTVS